MKLCAELSGIAQKLGTDFGIRTPIQIAMDRVQYVVRVLTTNMQASTMTTTRDDLISRALGLKTIKLAK